METTGHRAIAIVGAGCVLPDAPNVAAFWENVKSGRYSITEVSPDRWDPALYYDSDPVAPDKSYSRIGGWVRQFDWNPMGWRLAIPPRVVDAMDEAQRWAIACTRQALQDYGYPQRPLNTDRTAVILGNAMAGEKHYLTALRAYFPEYARELEQSASFAALPADVRREITRELHQRIGRRLPPITEDSMPGELANCIAGRIANIYNFHGPNFVADAACASAMAAMNAAVEGLIENDFDAAVTGGIDRNMGASTFIKFCKIGALSATGSRPYAEGADGFVMGEGAAIFLLKRLADAERDGDKIYAVIRGFGASSDGKGKGITAPNPIGQKLAIERAWQNAGLPPASATLMEGHGTSTRVGDVVEVESMTEVLRDHLPPHSIALGSVKSNIGHLKGAAGAAGILKTALALRDKVLPPSVQCERPNPDIDFSGSPLYVNSKLTPWTEVRDGARRAGVSAFGFGGTNFHAVLEEYIPHKLTGNGKGTAVDLVAPPECRPSSNAPLRGALVIGAASEAELAGRLHSVQQAAEAGRSPAPAAPSAEDLRAPERIAIDYAGAAELAEKCGKTLKALGLNQPLMWKALRAQGVFRGHGPAPKVAFLYPGQGSQYLNMVASLRATEPIVAETFAEADRVMTPLLGQPLSDYIFVDSRDPSAVAKAEEDLRQTAITQPAVLTVDLALTRLLAARGIVPDMTMGHSLGEYSALVASGALPFADALEAVSARGREMTRVSMADNGRMAAVFAPIAEIERILQTVDGYVVIANINSGSQAVIGGATKAVGQAIALFQNAGYEVAPLAVSHAFHTSIVAPASEPLRRTLQRLHLAAPKVPVVANVDGAFYPTGAEAVPKMLDILARQIASPVQFVKGLRTLYDEGARVFVEVGPKKALQGFAEDVLGDDVLSLFTNHPKFGDVVSFNQALCGLYASGLGGPAPVERPSESLPVTITGAAMGLPGGDRIFDDSNVARILRGDQFIAAIPTRHRHAMLDKHITRLVKSDNGGPTFETIENLNDTIKLAGRGGAFNLESEFGLSAERVSAFDRATALAIAAGIDALRDAGIPLLMRYKTTTKGTQLPDRWMLPDSMRDDTGVIFASAFPGCDSFAEIMTRHYTGESRRQRLELLASLRERVVQSNGGSALSEEIDRRMAELRTAIDDDPQVFDRRFLLRVLPMGHSQFAELVGARGPNTQINAACASTTQAVALAEDWIRAGRCRRVVVISADDVTSENLLGWFGAGFLASGAAATDEVVEEAAVPFDRRRHGLIMGMGAAAMVVECAEAARERGFRPICEVLSAVTANSAFHATRLDVNHISGVMETLIARAETRSGIRRAEIAPRTLFVSHETYTPARGGSAQAEIYALRRVFGDAAPSIVIANTKGMTGHAMATGIEDVVAVKALETGSAPPVVNYKEVDPELGDLNLSKGGAYPLDYALRLGAGFGSQISMTLLRWSGPKDVPRRKPDELGYAYRIQDAAAWQAWLARVAGHPAAELEVVHRTLRVRDQAPALPEPVAAPEPVEDIETQVLDIVAEKTGYPKDMLDLDLDLEADLGIDTVKQAEMFAAVRARYNLPRDENRKLRDFPTLAHVIRLVKETRPGTPAPVPPPPPSPDDTHAQVLAIVAEKTGYPKDMLDLDLDLEADLGIDTVKQAEVFAAVRARFNLPRDENRKLRDFPTLAHVIRLVQETRPGATPAPAVAAAPAPAAPPTPNLDDIKDRVLDIVAEKTGYPKDMLDLDLDLEADLGVDTVKQAEMFAAVRSAFQIPRDENLKLRDFPTLARVIQFAQERSGARAGADAPAADTAPAPARPVAASFEATDRVPRRVPVPVLRPPIDRCKPTGVALGPGSRVVIMSDQGGVAQALTECLHASGVEVVPWADDLAGQIQGVYWLPALDPEGADWREALRVRVKLLYATMRVCNGAFLVSATRLGGRHGYDERGAVFPMGGAVTGFTKAYKREQNDALVKAVDFECERSASEIAGMLIDETLRDPGAVEIGRYGSERWTIGLEERPSADGRPGIALGKDTVFVVTGAAGSIVSAITTDLAAASGGTFYLFDLVPEPDPRNPDLVRFVNDKDGLKRDLFARIQARGERATPVLVEKELAAIERAQAAQSAIDAVRAAGGTAIYISVNLADAAAVKLAIDLVRQRSGRIDVLLHAAGLERSRLLRVKDPAEFDLVFDVKAHGWFHLIEAIGDMPLAATVAFSSIAGRFGNAGQTDYSSANDLLCKIASSFAFTRPATRAIAIDWTAWGGIGMATRGSIPKIMEMAGIDMLPPEAGVPLIRRELTAGGARGEIVVANRLGIFEQEWDAAGGIDAAAINSPMISRATGAGLNSGTALEATLDPTIQPFLYDHQIEGTPVLPGVMGVEAFAEAALWILPGWHVDAVEDVEFLAPVKFYRNEPRTLTIGCMVRPEGDAMIADCRLTGSRKLANQAEPQLTTHFTGRVRLRKEPPAAAAAAPPPKPNGAAVESSDIYRVYFHGPAYRVVERAWMEGGRVVGRMPKELPPNHYPARRPLAMAPRLIELCFQTAGLWEIAEQNRMGLPRHIDLVRLCRLPEGEPGPFYAIVTPRPDGGAFDADVVDDAGNLYVQLRGYGTVALPNPVDSEPLRALHAVTA